MRPYIIPIAGLFLAFTFQVQVDSELEQPFRVLAEGEPIDVETGHSAPYFTDFNGDGLRDLLVGQFGDGKLRIYTNSGTRTEPRFSDFYYFQAAGADGTVPASWCVGFSPQFVDLDGDGHKDIISGGYPGELYLFRGNEDGTFRAREELINRYGETINVGKSSVPFACDWDLDGDLDLLVGTIEGHVYLIPNASDDVYFKYGNAERLTAGGEPIEADTGDAGPCVADWDGDGNHDLLLGGEDGRVLLFRNRSSDGMPELEAPIFLIPAGDMLIETGDEGSGSNIGGRTKLCVADWNGDGRDDLMAGVFAASRRDTIKSSSWEQVEYERLDQESKEIQQKQIIIRNEIRTRILKDLGVPVDERPPQEKMTEYMTRMGNELRKHTGYQELTGQITQVVRQRNRIKSQMSNPYEIHGWVWVFLRKDTTQ